MLLDTHAFVWFVEGNAKLGAGARSAIENEQSVLWLSLASVWEIAIKTSIGKLILKQPLEILIEEQMEVNAVNLLDIDRAAVLAVAQLPFHHRDPFDRLLVAAAAARKWRVVSNDAIFERYGLIRIW